MDVAWMVVVVNIYKESNGGYVMQEFKVMPNSSY